MLTLPPLPSLTLAAFVIDFANAQLSEGINDKTEGSSFHVDDLQFAGTGSLFQEVLEAGTPYHDLGALSFDEVDLARTINGPTVALSKKTLRTSSGSGPMLPSAHIKRDTAPNCQRPRAGPDFFETGQCTGTVRVHNPVNQYPSRDCDWKGGLLRCGSRQSLPKAYVHTHVK